MLEKHQEPDLAGAMAEGAADPHLDIVLEDDDALAAFLDDIDAEVNHERGMLKG